MEPFHRRHPPFYSSCRLSGYFPLAFLSVLHSWPSLPRHSPRGPGARRGRCGSRGAPVPRARGVQQGAAAARSSPAPPPVRRTPRRRGRGRARPARPRWAQRRGGTHPPPALTPASPPALPRPAPAPPPIPERGAAPRGLLPRPPATPARPQRRRCRGSKGRAGRERAGRGASRKPAGQVGGKGRETHKLSASPGRWRQAGWPWTERHRGSEEPGPAARRDTSEGSLQGTAPRARPCPRGHVGQRALQPGECGPRAAAGRAQVRAAGAGAVRSRPPRPSRAPSPAAPGAGRHLSCLLGSPSRSLRRP